MGAQDLERRAEAGAVVDFDALDTQAAAVALAADQAEAEAEALELAIVGARRKAGALSGEEQAHLQKALNTCRARLLSALRHLAQLEVSIQTSGMVPPALPEKG